MKTPFHKVRLKLFCDDVNGEWGVALKDCINNDNSFNAFWSGPLLFHEVFEHYFENINKHFKGDYSMNVGGEMAAMGHFYYYTAILGVSSRVNINHFRFHSYSHVMRGSTSGNLLDAIKYGYCDFGYTLESNVPEQKYTHKNDFESELDDYIYEVIEQNPIYRNGLKSAYNDKQEEEAAIRYKESVTEDKIRNLHRWGYYQAKQLVPDNIENQRTLEAFIEFWNKFTKDNSAEELNFRGVQYIDFEVFKDEDDIIEWKAYLILIDGKRYEVSANMLEILDEELLTESE